MARLLSVNIGLPRDIEWNGRTVHTGVWKDPVPGRCRVGRLNVEGDGQGDLAGHGGEHRAVFVYQIESYRYWQEQLKRPDLGDAQSFGQFGENFTIEGLPDNSVCIGDRYRIGSALFEVSQPRVTCYRIGIRMNEPRMPALLTASGRPGFYFRVLEQGEAGAGDEIIKVGEARERMTVAEINALLYSPNHPRGPLSGPLSARRYRISVKIEPNGVAGTWLRDRVRVGDTLDVSSPRGSFILQAGEGPVVLLSAGIGVTPVLAMLHALAAARSTRQVLWMHAARDREHHPFAIEVRLLVLALPRGRSHVCYSRPGSSDKLGEDFDSAGHLSRSVFEDVRLPRDADVYLCGPAAFMPDMKAALAGYGVPPERIHIEIFNGGETMSPGVVRTSTQRPHVPDGDGGTEPLVSFARSGIAAHWSASAYKSILELAEACDVPVRWSCRAGVCHNCESGLVSGEVAYGPEPLDKPADGNVLVCCSRPISDVVIDL